MLFDPLPFNKVRIFTFCPQSRIVHDNRPRTVRKKGTLPGDKPGFKAKHNRLLSDSEQHRGGQRLHDRSVLKEVYRKIRARTKLPNGRRRDWRLQ